MLQNINNGWMVLYVKHNHEKKIADKLSQQDISCYLPLIKQPRHVKGSTKVFRTKPLFSTYIFVKPSSRKEVYQTLKINGAFRFLKQGGKYCSVSNEEINSIRKVINSGFIRKVEIKYIKPEVGQEVFISKGPFQGLKGEIKKNKNECEVYLQIECLNQYVSVIIPLNHLDISNVKIQRSINSKNKPNVY